VFFVIVDFGLYGIFIGYPIWEIQ